MLGGLNLTFTDVLLIALLWVNAFTFFLLLYSHLKKDKPKEAEPKVTPFVGEKRRIEKKGVKGSEGKDDFYANLFSDDEEVKENT